MTCDGESCSVLLLDPDSARLSRLTSLLAARGWQVVAARTVTGALQALAGRPTQALVLAERATDGTALDLLAELPDSLRTFVLVHGPERSSPQPRPAGVHAWLPHPLLESEVASVLEEVRSDGPRPDLGAIERGAHAALLYHGRITLLKQLAEYFAVGLAMKERCVLACDDEAAADQARAHFERAGLPVASAERRGALLMLTHDECYFVGGRFDPSAMIQLLRDSVAAALEAGFSGVRGAGEGSWLPTTPEDEAAWFWYEREINSVFAGGNLTALCFYSLDRFPKPALLEALGSHPMLIDGRLVKANPHYAPTRAVAAGAMANAAISPEVELQLRLSELRARRQLTT